MHRLFVAIQPPRAIRQQLLAMMGGVPGARWQNDDQLHLTLRFIGEVDRHRAEDAAAALGAIHQPRFPLSLDGIGQFDRKGRIEALWVGVRPHDPLKALHNKIDQALARIGVAPEGRAYLPHITIARFGRAGGTIAPLIARGAPASGASFEVRDFCLYESELGHAGAIYSIIARYPLDEDGAG
jgi:2'-5' RNA ligase